MKSILPDDAVQRADDIEAAAFADLYAAAPAPLNARLGLAVLRHGGITALLAPAIPSAMFNRVIGFGLGEPAEEATLDSLLAAYREAGSPRWWLHWSPVARPADWPARLAARGFSLPTRRSWAKVMRPTSTPPVAETTLCIDRATREDAGATASAIVAAFEMPPFMVEWLSALQGRPGWTLYAARDGEQVVGGACLFVQGDTAWLGMGSVLPSHRRRGGQQTMLARRIADAAAAGCAWAVTETGEPMGDEPNPSLANMYRSGFENVASRLNFEWHAHQ